MNSMAMVPIRFRVWSRTGGAGFLCAALIRSTLLLCQLLFDSFSPWRSSHVQLYAPVRIVPRRLVPRIVMLPFHLISAVSSLALRYHPHHNASIMSCIYPELAFTPLSPPSSPMSSTFIVFVLNL